MNFFYLPQRYIWELQLETWQFHRRAAERGAQVEMSLGFCSQDQQTAGFQCRRKHWIDCVLHTFLTLVFSIVVPNTILLNSCFNNLVNGCFGYFVRTWALLKQGQWLPCSVWPRSSTAPWTVGAQEMLKQWKWERTWAIWETWWKDIGRILLHFEQEDVTTVAVILLLNSMASHSCIEGWFCLLRTVTFLFYRPCCMVFADEGFSHLRAKLLLRVATQGRYVLINRVAAVSNCIILLQRSTVWDTVSRIKNEIIGNSTKIVLKGEGVKRWREEGGKEGTRNEKRN